jgi:hypothetical protein
MTPLIASAAVFVAALIVLAVQWRFHEKKKERFWNEACRRWSAGDHVVRYIDGQPGVIAWTYRDRFLVTMRNGAQEEITRDTIHWWVNRSIPSGRKKNLSPHTHTIL